MTFFPPEHQDGYIAEDTLTAGMESAVIKAEGSHDTTTVDALFDLADTLGIDLFPTPKRDALATLYRTYDGVVDTRS